jgi:hypothetical protein
MIDQWQSARTDRLDLAEPGQGTMPVPGVGPEVTDRLFRVLVDNPPRHERLLRTIGGQDRAGDRDAVETYLRDADQSGDAWLAEALGGHRLAEVDRVQLIGAILDHAGAG